MKAYSIKRAALCVALGACLGVVLPGIAMAQNVSGAVAGRATAGDQVTVVSNSTGLTRTVTVGADGSVPDSITGSAHRAATAAASWTSTPWESMNHVIARNWAPVSR